MFFQNILGMNHVHDTTQGDLHVKGLLSITNSTIRSAEVIGKLTIDSSRVEHGLKVTGLLDGSGITADSIVITNATKATLQNSTIHGDISAENRQQTEGDAPTIILDGTIVSGDIVFDPIRKGHLELRNGACVLGRIINQDNVVNPGDTPGLPGCITQ
ncbi:MAG: hypothetical protein A2X78_01945 [Gammaproteobacteria bacterium GWE2_37_16]|nr:MAG: hypothetical protein A2X78_01945 [Gammaproteobacteria bacterium GWE2_37_16]